MILNKENLPTDGFLESILDGTLSKKTNLKTALLSYFFLVTGLTPADISNIKASDFNATNRTITLRIQKKKLQTTSTHKLPKQQVIQLLALRAKDQLFPLSHRRMQQLIKEASEIYNSPYNTPTKLRKLYVQAAVQSTSSKEKLTELTQLTSIAPRRTLSSSEVQRIKQAPLKLRIKLLITTQLQTGLRVNELLQLQQKHLVNNNTITLTSDSAYNNKPRNIAISQQLYNQLINVNTEFLFATNRGTQLTQRRYEQLCESLRTTLNIPDFSPSVLRATAIKLLSQKFSYEQLLHQTGLNSSTLYTHAILPTMTTTTSSDSEIEDATRKDDANHFAPSSQYVRSRLRKDGGDADE